MIVMLAEVFERLERLFEGYVEKVNERGSSYCRLMQVWRMSSLILIII